MKPAVGLYGIYSRGELVARQTCPPDRREVLSAVVLLLSHGGHMVSLVAKVAEISSKRSSVYTQSHHGMGHNSRQAQRGATETSTRDVSLQPRGR